MHEGGLAHRLLDEALGRAAGKPLARIAVRVGALSGVAPESMEMHLEAAAVEHGIEDLAIATVVTPARLKCSCGREFETTRITDPCPSCGGMVGRTILSGRDCAVEAVETA